MFVPGELHKQLLKFPWIDVFTTNYDTLLEQTVDREEFEHKLDSIYNTWSEIKSMFPVFFYRKSDKHLNTLYKLKDVEKELKLLIFLSNSM